MNLVPTNCPSCNYPLEWNKTNIDLFCYNKDCSAKGIKKILHFFHTLNNLDGFGPKTIERLVESGFDTIPKIYNMKYEHFQDCNYQHKTIMNLGSELEESKDREITPSTFIASLGIGNLGYGSAKKLMEKYKIEDFLNLRSENIIEIDGFGNTTSYEIAEEIQERQEEIFNILSIGFNIKYEIVKVIKSSITGKRICFTGKMSGNRKQIESNAAELGATPVGAVNSKTDILVYGENVGKNKTNAAEKFNVKCLSEIEYLNLIK